MSSHSLISLQRFKQLAKQYNLVILQTELIADTETPVSVFQRFRTEPYSFLLESVEGQERWAQYSFIGFSPLQLFRSCGDRVETARLRAGTLQSWKIQSGLNPLDALKRWLHQYKATPVETLPRFAGGALGYMGYDMMAFIETMPQVKQQATDPWDCFFMIPQVLLVFDNRKQVLRILYHVPVTKQTDCAVAYRDAVAALEGLKQKLCTPVTARLVPAKTRPIAFKARWTKSGYMQAVKQIQEYIRAGDCIQAVLSLRFQTAFNGDSFNIYRALRHLNPSPYLYYLHMGDHDIVGASPETMVRLEGRQLTVRPIAGTRPRGRNSAADQALAQELLADPKERAEHIMLVDLGRNDLGRVAEPASVQVDELMNIERYSHVMHIVSNISATLRAQQQALDVLKATFPAGTLSGAPKIRAMEIVYQLEPTRRGVYGGCIGYIDFAGNMDTAIAIRTAMVYNGQVSVQAGAGIVLDSKPAAEYQECLNKATAVMRAVELAERFQLCS